MGIEPTDLEMDSVLVVKPSRTTDKPLVLGFNQHVGMGTRVKNNGGEANGWAGIGVHVMWGTHLRGTATVWPTVLLPEATVSGDLAASEDKAKLCSLGRVAGRGREARPVALTFLSPVPGPVTGAEMMALGSSAQRGLVSGALG